MSDIIAKRAGFVSIVGRPNVGKSTLLNTVIGQKIAGVSPKPQTTRQLIRGILSDQRGQIVFLDTPGLHKPRDPLGKRMISNVESSFMDADLIYFMVSPHAPGTEERAILENLKTRNKPIVLVVNKADAVSKPDLLPVLDSYQKLHAFASFFPISALRNQNVKELLDQTFKMLPEGEPFFPTDIASDQTERFIVSEFVREKVFRLAGKEVPYATTVQIDQFQERSDKLVAISATIIVERLSQKRIIIGEGGKMIKRIGTDARKDIEEFLGKKVFLELWVKEKENWKNDANFLNELERESGNG